MVERSVDWEVLFVALVITVAVMAGMFFLGQEFSQWQVDRIGRQVEELTVERNSQDLSRRLAQNLPQRNCEALNVAVRETIEDVESLRQQVATYEQTHKIENPDFTLLKKRYTNLLIEYWLTTQQIETRCGSNVTTVLYIYHDPDVCERCEDQGTVLTRYRQQYEDRLLVFPLDATLDLPTVNVLIDAYEVSSDDYPVLIIDGDVHRGYKDRDALGDILSRYVAAAEGS